MSVRRSLSATLVLSLCLAMSRPAMAQRGPATGRSNRVEEVLADWNRRLEKADELILGGKYRKAHALATDVAEEITHRTVRWEGAARGLALASMLRALSAAGLEEYHEAHWFWHVAIRFMPELADFGLDSYGAVGETVLSEPPVTELVEWTDEPDPARPGVTPPRAKRQILPEYPLGMMGERGDLSIAVEVTVSEEGHPTRPRVVSGEEEPTLVYQAFDAFWKWRFEPATLDCTPVAADYTIVVHFTPTTQPDQPIEIRGLPPR